MELGLSRMWEWKQSMRQVDPTAKLQSAYALTFLK